MLCLQHLLQSLTNAVLCRNQHVVTVPLNVLSKNLAENILMIFCINTMCTTESLLLVHLPYVMYSNGKC